MSHLEAFAAAWNNLVIGSLNRDIQRSPDKAPDDAYGSDPDETLTRVQPKPVVLDEYTGEWPDEDTAPDHPCPDISPAKARAVIKERDIVKVMSADGHRVQGIGEVLHIKSLCVNDTEHLLARVFGMKGWHALSRLQLIRKGA